MHATNKTSGNDTTLVLLLSGPVYDKAAGTLAFNVTPAAAGSKLKLAGGAADSALANARAVNLRQPAAGLQLTVGLGEVTIASGCPTRGGAERRCAHVLCSGDRPQKCLLPASISEAGSKLLTESHSGAIRHA